MLKKIPVKIWLPWKLQVMLINNLYTVPSSSKFFPQIFPPNSHSLHSFRSLFARLSHSFPSLVSLARYRSLSHLAEFWKNICGKKFFTWMEQYINYYNTPTTLRSKVHNIVRTTILVYYKMPEKHNFITFKNACLVWEGGWEHGQFFVKYTFM